MLRPGLLVGAYGEGRGAHQPRAALEGGQRAVLEAEEERLLADIDAAIDRHPAPAALEVGVGGEQVGQSGETIGRAHSCKMYSIVDPSEALKAVFTQRPRSSNHWSLVTSPE